MRFEELSYRVDGLPVTVPFHAALTVVNSLSGRARLGWIERALGVLLGTRPGDGVRVVFVDSAGNRVRLERDHQGAATVTDVVTGEEVAYAAGHLSLDGRFDWFASIGLDTDAARALILLDAAAFKRDGDFDPHEAEADLSEARRVLAQVEAEYQSVAARSRQVEDLRHRAATLEEQIRLVNEERARRRHGEAVRTVRRLETELAILNGAVPPERAAAEAALAAARAGEEWGRAAAALEAAQSAFGDRRRLGPETLQRALSLPTEAPAGLEDLQADYLSLARHRADLVARLDEGAAAELPAPSAPWVLGFARHGHPELWARAERVRAARTRVAELSLGLDGTGQHGDLVHELELAHEAVERAERQLDSAKVPALAMAAKRRLAKAQQHELAVLNRMGFASWLSFQMRRIDVLLEHDPLEALRSAEVESELATVAWMELAGDVDAEAALAARAEVERYAVAMAAAESTVAAAEVLRRRLTEEVEPAWAEARAALLEACRPLDVDPDDAASQVSAMVAQARDARLQQALEEAESACRAAEARLEPLLAGAGLPAGSGDLAFRVAKVTGRAAEAAVHLETPVSSRSLVEVQAELSWARAALAAHSRPDWDDDPVVSDTPLPDTDALTEERARLLEEASRAERGLPDVGRIEDRRQALQRRVAILEASSRAGYQLLSLEEAEMVLLGRIAQARRVGPKAEPVPIVVDDALAGFPRPDKWSLLDLLARLAGTIQVVYLTDDPDTVEWASARARAGDALVLQPDAVASVA